MPVNETVTVSSVPTALETETSSRGQVIGTQEIEDLPLNGRSYADLALLAPGVRKSFLENQSTTSREASFNVNGQRSASNNFLLNGLDNNSYGTSNQGFGNENIPPSPDAVSEFRLETDNYSAEYGRASGAVINASIRRGTNRFHGRHLGLHPQHGSKCNRALRAKRWSKPPSSATSCGRRRTTRSAAAVHRFSPCSPSSGCWASSSSRGSASMPTRCTPRTRIPRRCRPCTISKIRR